MIPAAIILCFILVIVGGHLFRHGFIFSKLQQSKYGSAHKFNGILAAKQPSKNISELSILRTVIWSIVFGGRRLVNLYMYIGGLNHMVETSFLRTRYLFINDFKTAKEALKNPLVCGRSKLSIFDFYTQGALGILTNFGKEWKEHRKFSHLYLKSFGLGTKANEAHIQNSVEKLCDEWSNKNGNRFSPTNDFYLAVVNSLWVILAGEEALNETSELVLNLYKDVKCCLSHFNALVTGSNVSLKTIVRIHNLIPIFGAFKSLSESIVELRSYFQDVIDRRRENFIPNNNPTDLVDAYLNAIFKQSQNGPGFSTIINEKHLLTVMFDILFAGGDTTGNALSWAILHLARNPQVQEKIWNEIDTVVGRDRNPCLNDRLKCPFTEAFINEVLRFSPVLPQSVPHAASNDTFVGGNRILKDTVVMFNIYRILQEPSIWDDPHNFRPERFLSEDGTAFVKNEAMCIFSMGPRKCIGEKVARDTLFLFTATICKKFRILRDPLLKDFTSLADDNSTIHAPSKFYIVTQDRL